jgi:hypothetical protein
MINAGRVQKRKIFEDFENELKVKGLENREKYENDFRTILNSVYKHSLEDIRPSITRFNTLSVLLIKEHKFIYLEVDEKRKHDTLLSINIMDDIDKGGLYNLPLKEALKKIDIACRSKV